MTKIAYVFVLTGLFVAALGVARSTADVSKMTRDEYVNYVETKLKEWDTTVSNMKARRDGLASTSDRYQSMDRAISTMEEETRDIRDDLKNLRNSAGNWMEHQAKIEKNFTDLTRAQEKGRLAE